MFFEFIKEEKNLVSFLAILFALICGTVAYFYFDFFDIHSNKIEGSQSVSVLLKGREFVTEIADEPEERIQGLSGRASLGTNEAMLFVFEELGDHGFWMKGMNFPIDIIWFDPNFKVVTIASSVSPQTYPQVLHSDEPALYVLEVYAGFAANIGLEEGDHLRSKDLQSRMSVEVKEGGER